MTTISIQADTVGPSVDCRSDDATFRAGTFSWQDPVNSWRAGPGEDNTVENSASRNTVLYFRLLPFDCNVCSVKNDTKSRSNTLLRLVPFLRYRRYHSYVSSFFQTTYQLDIRYRKVASSNTSRLEAHACLFRLLMKETFDPYVLWLLTKSWFFNW